MIEVATTYVANLGGENKVCTRELRKQLKVYSKNLYPSICDVVRIIITCAEDGLGFEYREKLTIYCECSAFYGKTLNSYTIYSLSAEKYLNSENMTTIEKFYRQIPSFIKANLEELEFQCPDKFCSNKKVASSKIKTLQEPSSLMIEIKWEEKPEALEILKLLIGIDFKLPLDQIFPRLSPKNLYFRGMILETPDKSRLYCTRLSDLGFVLISENKITPIKGGNWQNTVFNLSIHFYRPLLVFYEASEEELIDDMELLDIEYIQLIVLQKSGFMDKWTCFNCEYVENPENEICTKCNEKRTSVIKKWKCQCNTFNSPKSKYCKECDRSRFKPIQSKCLTCNQPKLSINCVNCNSFKCSFPICRVKLKYGQKMYHGTSLTKCYGNCLKCQNFPYIFPEFLCKTCFSVLKSGQKILHPDNESFSFKCSICLNTYASTQQKFCLNCDLEIQFKYCVTCYPMIKEAIVCEPCQSLLKPLSS